MRYDLVINTLKFVESSSDVQTVYAERPNMKKYENASSQLLQGIRVKARDQSHIKTRAIVDCLRLGYQYQYRGSAR